MAEGLEPIALAVVVCDAIHVDPATGKRTLLGVFSTIFSAEFPALVRIMAVHVTLTECRGKFPVVVQIVDTNEEREPVARIEGEVESEDPLGMMELDFWFGNLQFPEPGEYRVQLFAAGEPIIERRLVVAAPPSQGHGDE